MLIKQGWTQGLLPFLRCTAEVVLYCLWFLVSQLIVTLLFALPYTFAKITLLLQEGVSPLQAGQELLRLFNEDFLPQHTPWISLLSAVLAAGVLILVIRRVYPPWKKHLRLERAEASSFGPIAPLAVALQIVISLTLVAVTLLPVMEEFSQQMQEYSHLLSESSHKWVELLAVVVAAPLCEELFFRGAVLSALKRTPMPLWLAVTLQAALFGLIHGLPLQMAYAFLLGLLLGYLTEKFQCLWHGVLFHALFNGAGYWTELLSDSPPVWLLAALWVTAAVIAVFSLRKVIGWCPSKEKGEENAT